MLRRVCGRYGGRVMLGCCGTGHSDPSWLLLMIPAESLSQAPVWWVHPPCSSSNTRGSAYLSPGGLLIGVIAGRGGLGLSGGGRFGFFN